MSVKIKLARLGKILEELRGADAGPAKIPMPEVRELFDAARVDGAGAFTSWAAVASVRRRPIWRGSRSASAICAAMPASPAAGRTPRKSRSS